MYTRGRCGPRKLLLLETNGLGWNLLNARWTRRPVQERVLSRSALAARRVGLWTFRLLDSWPTSWTVRLLDFTYFMHLYSYAVYSRNCLISDRYDSHTNSRMSIVYCYSDRWQRLQKANCPRCWPTV